MDKFIYELIKSIEYKESETSRFTSQLFEKSIQSEDRVTYSRTQDKSHIFLKFIFL